MELEEKLTKLKNLKIDLQVTTQKRTDMQKEFDTLTDEIIEIYQARKIKSMKVRGVGNFFTYQQSNPKVIDQILLREWMDSNGFDYSIVQMFSAQKFRGFYRELLDNQKPLPPGCENYVKTGIKIGKE